MGHPPSNSVLHPSVPAAQLSAAGVSVARAVLAQDPLRVLALLPSMVSGLSNPPSEGQGSELARRVLERLGEAVEEAVIPHGEGAAEQINTATVRGPIEAGPRGIRWAGHVSGSHASLVASAMSITGPVRKQNEDRVLGDPSLGLVAVADGVGGTRHGALAASIVLRRFHQEVAQLRNAAAAIDEQEIHALVQRVRRDLCGESAVHGVSDLACTLTAVLVLSDHAIVAHVGDSRAYRVRDGVAVCLTDDHTHAADLVAQGVMSSEDAARSPARHWLSRSMSPRSSVVPDVSRVDLRLGDQLLVMSDGVHGRLAPLDLVRCTWGRPTAEGASRLVKLALSRRARDNITAAVMSLEPALPGVLLPELRALRSYLRVQRILPGETLQDTVDAGGWWELWSPPTPEEGAGRPRGRGLRSRSLESTQAAMAVPDGGTVVHMSTGAWLLALRDRPQAGRVLARRWLASLQADVDQGLENLVTLPQA